MMDSSEFSAARGLWSNPSASQSSKENQQLLQSEKQTDTVSEIINYPIPTYPVMKQESRLSSQQRTQKEQTNHGAASPRPTRKSGQRALPCVSRRRSAESCRGGSSYQRERFHPAPTRDLEKEKRRLQSILATGKEKSSDESTKKAKKQNLADEPDEYEEVSNEIEERRQFLADLASLGQDGPYIDIINTEISQKLRELELLDEAGRPVNPDPQQAV